MEIHYRTDALPDPYEVIELYNDAGLPRPTDDVLRIKKMLENSDIIISAWYNNTLIGLARSLTDFSWCCYLADLAVSSKYQDQGIGRRLMELTKEVAGDQSMLLLLSVPGAMEYYPKVGFTKIENGFIKPRSF